MGSCSPRWSLADFIHLPFLFAPGLDRHTFLKGRTVRPMELSCSITQTKAQDGQSMG